MTRYTATIATLSLLVLATASSIASAQQFSFGSRSGAWNRMPSWRVNGFGRPANTFPRSNGWARMNPRQPSWQTPQSTNNCPLSGGMSAPGSLPSSFPSQGDANSGAVIVGGNGPSGGTFPEGFPSTTGPSGGSTDGSTGSTGSLASTGRRHDMSDRIIKPQAGFVANPATHLSRRSALRPASGVWIYTQIHEGGNAPSTKESFSVERLQL